MFNEEYSFRCNRNKVKKLTSQFDNNSTYKLFNRNIDIYLIAPIIGFMFGRQANIDKTSDDTVKIMGDRVIKSAEDLKYIYKLIVLLDSKHEPNA